MQYIIIAYDGTDENVLERRLSVREQHLKLVEENVKQKKQIYGGAILDESGKMIGSMMVMEYSSREELDKWLEAEPYIVANVWEKIEIKPFNVPPIFNKA